jgi:hypothetical protein
MLGSTSPVYEIVRGQIRLSKREEFFRLHRERLVPMLLEANIEPVLLLCSEIGPYGRFLDVFRYGSLTEYGQKTDAFLSNPRVGSYYKEVGECIMGSIDVELALEIPQRVTR